MKPTPAPFGRVSARAGLVGGILLGVTVLAQQWTPSPDLNCLGTLMIVAGFATVGWYAAREAGVSDRRNGQRAGGLAGLIAGVVAAMALSAMFLLVALGPVTPPAISVLQEQSTPALLRTWLQSFYGPEQADLLIRQPGFSLEEYAAAMPRITVAVTMACCGLGLPIVGLFLGSLGGALGRSEPDRTNRPGG
jgi:hypothetical protein